MPTEILTQPADNPIPRKLWTRGLRDYHPHPLVADLKDEDGLIFPWRMDPREAWQKPYVEIQPANSWAVAVLDCDDPEWVLGAMAQQVPKPSFFVLNHANEHAQLGWILQSPIHRNKQSARSPLLKFGCVVGKLTDLYRADPGFQNQLVRNPAYTDDTLSTVWCHRRFKGYTLDQLDVTSDVRPAEVLLARSAVGRNVSVFEGLMQFAGSPRNCEADLVAEALRLNGEFEVPLAPREIRYITRSVDRYRQQWIREGRYYRHDTETQRDRQAWQVVKRWEKAEDRDLEILRRAVAGGSTQSIATKLGLARMTIQRVLSNESRLREVSKHLRHNDHWSARRYIDKRFGKLFKKAVETQ